jgi:SAM-dependent methyltransferase
MSERPAALEYTEIFDLRGSRYDAAMRLHPLARRREFEFPLRMAALRDGDRLLDMPAGGGYLRDFVPPGVTWVGYEPSRGFGALADAGGPLHETRFEAASFDACVSVAGVHHIVDKRPLFAEWRRVLKPGGRLVLLDASVGSPTARFLDGFVDRHTDTGHAGVYLDAGTGRDLAACGFRVLESRALQYPWLFASRREAAEFCSLLFGLRPETPVGRVEAELAAVLGFDAQPDGGVGLRWSLQAYSAVAV